MFSKKFCPEVWAMSELFYSAKYSLKIFCRIAMTAVVVFQLDEPKNYHYHHQIIFMRLFPRAGAIQE